MKTIQLSFLVAFCLCAAQAQLSQKARPDPVPILKQISKQNDDGSYSFGYEAGDGSYKIETKFPDGEVQGKYGYVDDEGKLREVEYGAGSKQGFRPQGNGINVPPPALTNEVRAAPLAEGEEDDGQYREDPSIYDTKDYRASHPAPKASRRPAFQASPPQPIYQQPARQVQEEEQEPLPIYQRPRPKQTGYQRPLSTAFKFQLPQYQQQPQYNNYQQPQQVRYEQPQAYQQPQVYQQPQAYQAPQTFRQNLPSFNNYQQPSQNLDYQEPIQQSYSVFQSPSFQQPGRSFSHQPQAAAFSHNPQPQYASFNLHPSVKNFDLGTGSYSINYSGR